MARVKKAKWKSGPGGISWEEAEQHRRERRQAVRTQRAMGDALPEDISNDNVESQDGGASVIIDSDNVMMHDSTPPESMAPEQYLQKSIVSCDQTLPLWKPPPGKLLDEATTKHHPDLAISRVYAQCYCIIRKQWNCDFEQWIPDHLRGPTPYSLALLYTIRRLADNTKGHYEIAQTAISRAWHERVDQIDSSHQSEQPWLVGNHPYYAQPRCEETVQENVFGLMIMDVFNALHNLVSDNYSGLPNPKQMGKAHARGIVLTRRESKKPKKRRLKVEKQIAKKKLRREKRELKLRNRTVHVFKSGMQGSANPIPPNRPTLSNKKLEALSRQFTLSNYAESHGEDSVQQHQQDQCTGEAPSALSAYDKENYRTMATLLHNIDIDRHKRMIKGRRRKMEAGGRSRRNTKGGILLPSEKIDFNRLPALPPAVSGLTSEQLPQLSKLSLDELPV